MTFGFNDPADDDEDDDGGEEDDDDMVDVTPATITALCCPTPFTRLAGGTWLFADIWD